jgi:hypothetical protein
MNLRKVVGIFALLVFVGSLIIHLLTYSSVNLGERYIAVWGLFPTKLLQFRAWSGFWAWTAIGSMLYLLTATRRSLPKPIG